ncbi:MAG TPA: DUF4149 domain-containing protein [Blastocatellia bacterium]|nr:DUF4149 domain-containing protein [Blastocatellia bacterium]
MRNLLTLSVILEMVAITVWVGGMATLALIAAPAIFQTAPSRESAGRTFGLILKRFAWVAYGCGAAILIAGAIRWGGSWHGLTAPELVRYIIALLMVVLALYSGLVVSRKLDQLRERMAGGIDRVPKDDPRRVEFNKLHGVSMTLVAFNVLLGFAMAVMFVL